MQRFSRRRLLSWAAALPLYSKENENFLEDLSRRAFQYFWEQADAKSGLVLDRARCDGSLVPGRNLEVVSTSLTGFYLTALCIAHARNWRSKAEIRERVRSALQHFLFEQENVFGWYYHFVDRKSRSRVWNSEVSTIDTAVLLAGVITAQQCYGNDPEIAALASRLYARVDFFWMLDRETGLLRMGWRPESGFLRAEWKSLNENAILAILAIGSPSRGIPAKCWYLFSRDAIELCGYRYVGRGPIFTHQYSQAWMDLRNRVDGPPYGIDYFQNSVVATYALRALCISLRGFYPSYSEDLWGVTPSDSDIGYVIWGDPLSRKNFDGTVVPSAAAGSLMFAPEICLPALRFMHAHFADTIYGPYGFADSFHPLTGWVNPDIVGIDQGITLLSAENLRSGNAWKWFGSSPDVRRAMRDIFQPC